MRGFAALAVLGFHLYSPPLEQRIAPLLPAFGRHLLDHGWLGVQVFFVLSGFVIAHSLRRVEPSAAFVGRFVLRRSLRLDPPYWATILLALLSLALSNAMFTERHLPIPSAAAIGSHLFYLQDMLGYGQIVDVFWTLCLEFQMYLVFVLLVTAGEALGALRLSPRGRTVAAVGSLGLLFAGSLWAAAAPSEQHKVWFLAYWYQFFLGALTYWAVSGRVRVRTLLAAGIGCLLLTQVASPFEALTALATASILALAAWKGKLGSWLSARPMQWLGRISYSLYLTHTVFISRGWNGLSRWGWLEGRELLFTLALGAGALLAADVWHRAFERPALLLSRRIPLVAGTSEPTVRA